MAAKTVFLLSLFVVASSKLPHIRRCDPEPPRDRPTHCSNYENILYLNRSHNKIEKKQKMLEDRINAVDRKARQSLESASSNMSTLEILVTNLSSALRDLERAKKQSDKQTEKEFKETKTQLERHRVDIAGLKAEVRDLVKHRARVGGNFSELEKKLDTTERQLREKTARLVKLEAETEAAFNDTQRLLSLYKSELSNLNVTAHELQAKAGARMDSTKTELDAKLKKIQNSNEAFSSKLKKQEAKVDKFKEESDSRLKSINVQLQAQKSTVDKQKSDIDSLRSNTAGLKTRLGSAEGKLAEQNNLKQALNRLTREVNAKVAFSATIIESKGVFTGPAETHNGLIFDRVFTNTGNAYNSKTGLFTAPLKGVYYFSFMTFGYNSYTSGAILVKNGHYQVSTWEFRGPDHSDTTSNSVILPLNVGETVCIILWKGGKVHTSVFSGFLLFLTS